MKAAAAGSAAAGTIWSLKALPVGKLLWTLPVVAMTALFATNELNPSLARSNRALESCAANLAQMTLDRNELARKQEDGSLLQGLTAASFNVEVEKSNEDILRMSPESMARQIEQMRKILARYDADNKRLGEEKRKVIEEKSRMADDLAKKASLAGTLQSGQAACESKLRETGVRLSTAQDQLERSQSEHMTTKSRLDETKDQLKQADVLLERAKQTLLNTQTNLERTKALLTKCTDEQRQSVRSVQSVMTAATRRDRRYLGYHCGATREDMRRYNSYNPFGACPNDWYFVQRLIFKKNCFSLPRRKCRAVTPNNPADPLPFPQSLFDQSALKDRNVRWDLHQCKSFECLNSRKAGDCRQCFNLSLEATRWQAPFRGAIPMKEVIEMKKGSLRLGLDVGGGTGSFAAHMAKFGVTVMTTAFNVETISGQKAGLPYMEAIAARGLIPLHIPHKSRLPLYDGVLDLVHSVNSIKYLPIEDFEELVYEWDRVLRVGGIFWFEMFYAPVEDMPKYVSVIDRLQYKKLYWNYTPKTDIGERGGAHIYLNCILEKQRVPGKEWLDAPRPEDMEGIV